MPRKEIVDKAKRDLAQGKSPSTAAGEFVREEMDHIRQGKHGARSTKQVGVVLEGRYVIKGFIGKGGMARVYLAEDVIA